MDVGELLSFQPKIPTVSNKRKNDNFDNSNSEFTSKRSRQGRTGSSKFEPKNPRNSIADTDKIIEMIDSQPETEMLDESGLKKIILQFEKKVLANQSQRIKYPDLPEKFMDSEMALNDVISEMHVVATVPELYQILVDLNSVQTLLQLLSHENSDISIAVVDLLQEMTDVDALTESEDGANILIDALLEGQIVALLVHNLERLDETVREESEGVHNTLAIIENMTELRPDVSLEGAKQGLMTWLLRRLRAKLPFDANKLYASEILAILLQSHAENRKLLGESDGIDVLLQQLAAYKRHDASSNEEIEMMENLFNCLCSALMLVENRDRFLRGEGLQLMNLMLREKKLSRSSAIKVLNHAVMGPEGVECAQKFIDILGLRSIFPLFMKTPKQHKAGGPGSNEMEEHIVSIIASLAHNSQGAQRQRFLNKFTENDHEKVDRLMELHFKYLGKARKVDERIEAERENLKIYGEVDEEEEDRFYLQRLDAGLFTLQLIDYVLVDTCIAGTSGIHQRVMQILNLKGGSVKTIRNILREYAGNIGDAKNAESQEAEQSRILNLVDKF